MKNLEKKLDDISTPMTVSIIGCVVNGPGEATMTDIGITGGGNGTHMIYLNGKKNNVVKNVDLENYLEKLIRKRSKETNFFIEFDKIWIHGYLHLIGYDHKKNNDYQKMFRKEKLILKYFHKVT